MYGGDVMALPRFAPFSPNWTFFTATLSEDVAVRTTVPVAMESLAGLVIATVGGVLSILSTVTAMDDEAWLPFASVATAFKVVVPLLASPVFQETE